MKVEEIILNEERNVRLSAWIQQVGGEFAPMDKRPAILVLPGGGYSMCSDREADPVAAAFLGAGYQAFILRYSTGEYKTWPNPLNDYELAMKMIRDRAGEWHVDPERVGVVGFSAGGHLAACAATVAQNRPNAAILGYAALTKTICDVCQPGMPYPVEHVDGKTPACFLFATRDDNVVDISNTIAFEQALADKGIAFEAHIYSYGMHGFSTGLPCVNNTSLSRRTRDWVGDSLEWLEEIWGAFTAKGFSEPVCSRLANGDMAERLSVGCTLAHLSRQLPEVQELLKDVYAAVDGFIQGRYTNPEAARQVIYAMRLSDIMQLCSSRRTGCWSWIWRCVPLRA